MKISSREQQYSEINNTHANNEIAKAKNGDKKAWENLYQKYVPQLTETVLQYFSNREDAEEAVSEAMFTAFTRLHDFPSNSDFYKWLVRIVLNNAKRGEQSDTDASTLTSLEVANPESLLMKIEDEKFVHELLARLEPQAAELLRLRDFEYLSYTEISKRLGIPEHDVISGYLKALKQFEQLGKEEKRKFD
ncbi:TPA: hypothetical protein DEP96_00040 [Candidatus Uhrbacteria bacterium]|nr:hypothetical protein [Candidatus Uhrbacteria bacterium]